MKKIGIIAALALVTTVGGVYATWDYAGKKVDTITAGVGIKITDATSDTVHGALHVHKDTLALVLDDVGDYTPGWNATVTDSNGGNLNIHFKPSAGCPEDVSFTYTITITGNTFNDDGTDKPIFSLINGQPAAADGTGTLASDTVQIDLATATPDEQGAYTIKVYSYTDFISLLTVNNDIQVDTLEEYNEFSEAVSNVTITVTVTDVTPTANP